MTDAELARVAISPDGLDGLVETFVCGQTGPDGEPLPTGAWYWDAVKEHVASLPRLVPEALHATNSPAAGNQTRRGWVKGVLGFIAGWGATRGWWLWLVRSRSAEVAALLADVSELLREKSVGAANDKQIEAERLACGGVTEERTTEVIKTRVEVNDAMQQQAAADRAARGKRVSDLVEKARGQLKVRNAAEAIRRFREAEELSASTLPDDARALFDALRADIGPVERIIRLRADSYRRWPDAKGLDTTSNDYRQFFADTGIRGGSRTPQQAGEKIRQKGDAATFYVAALDSWAGWLDNRLDTNPDDEIRTGIESLKKELDETARVADRDAASSQVRRMLGDKDTAGLVKYLETDEIQNLHPELVARVVRYLIEAGQGEAGFTAVNKAWWTYPNDPSINFGLASYHRATAKIAGLKPEVAISHFREALHFFSLALASDPGNAVFWAYLGLSYCELGMEEQAKYVLRRAYELDRDDKVLPRDLSCPPQAPKK